MAVFTYNLRLLSKLLPLWRSHISGVLGKQNLKIIDNSTRGIIAANFRADESFGANYTGFISKYEFCNVA